MYAPTFIQRYGSLHIYKVHKSLNYSCYNTNNLLQRSKPLQVAHTAYVFV